MTVDKNQLKRHVDGWLGNIPWEKPVSGTKVLHAFIRAGENGPTEQQISLLEELESRYDSLWQQIELQLAVLTETSRKLPQNLKPRVLLFMPGVLNDEIFDFTLGYEPQNQVEDNEGYFLSFRNWKIEHAIKAT